MTQGQPPGWSPPPGSPPQQGWAQPPQSPQLQPGQPQPGQPQGQPQYGQPQYGQPQYGQPQYGQPQYGQPQYGQPQGQPQYGQPPQGPPPSQGAWASPAPSQGLGGSVGFGATAAAMPVKQVGFFDKIPCPHCGSPMHSSAGMGGTAGRMVGGLVGWLVVTALASEYHCPTHGQIPKTQLPPEHRSVATTRKILMLGGAASLLVLVMGCVLFSAVLQGMR